MTTALPGRPKTKALQSAETRDRLVLAAIDSLVEQGFAATTAVEVCARAGLSRGAYNHHYADLATLFADVLTHLYGHSLAQDTLPPDPSLACFILAGWERTRQPEFKALIELWLASRNNPELDSVLLPLISQLSELFQSSSNPDLAAIVGDSPELDSIYRLAFETLIGLALGRATTIGSAPAEHEERVIGLLLDIANERAAAPG